jgi:flavin reductase (DIM6/NTAB) family NADH-FMN oxidoreductase RutF
VRPVQQDDTAAAQQDDTADLRTCLGAFVTGVTVVTTVDADGRRAGMTANSFSSVSLDPPLVQWSQQTSLPSHPVFRSADRFAVNILAADQVEESRVFARPADDKFARVATRDGLGGVPLLEGCAAYLECTREATYPGGDHVIFLGRVERYETHPHRKPLAFNSGRYMTVHPHDPGPFTADLAASSVQHLDALEVVGDTAGELSAELDVTVGVAVWGNKGPTVVRWRECSEPLAMRLRTGLVLPLLSSATGRCFAAHLPPDEVEHHLRTEEDVDPAVLAGWEPSLEAIRRDGIAGVTSNLVPEANERAIDAVSAPVFGRGGHLVAVLTLMTHAPRLEQPDGPEVRRLQAVAHGLSQRLGAEDETGNEAITRH